VIRHVAHILRKNVRPQDIVARFGGEEFVVFLDEQNSKVGYEVAERMRQNIASEVCDFNGQSLRVTVSIGGSMKEAVDRIEDSIGEADEAMYNAKQAGRNRIVFRSNFASAFKMAIND
jgi:diguanylate cyclase (GGDEF)-like protein